MNKIYQLVSVMILLVLSVVVAAEEEFSSIFKEGSVSGNVRVYYNTRDYSPATDTAAIAFGGALRAETGTWGESDWGKLGVGYYSANDMGLNSDDPTKVNRTLGDELEVLAEAYVELNVANTKVTLGRQKFNSPFANPSDAFIVPMTFMGYAAENKSVENLTLKFGYLNEFKTRNSDQFVDVGAWSTARYGVDVTNTSGTVVLGATYKPGSLTVQGWHYQFTDLFSLSYLQADYSLAPVGELKPFVGVQYGMQSDVGDKLLGAVESSVLGLKVGAGIGKSKITLAYNSVPEEEESFKNGAFLAPFNYSTSPLFTNNMLQTVENNDAGDGIKITFNYLFSDNMPFKISYATFDFETIPDRDDIDIDFIYNFKGKFKGLSVRSRTTVVTSDVDTVEQTNNRIQLQYVY